MTALRILNWINGKEVASEKGGWVDKFCPHTGKIISQLAASTAIDTQQAITVAEQAFIAWRELTPIRRGQILFDVVAMMKEHAKLLAECIAVETAKPPQDAEGEISAAIAQAEYFASEGMRLYGHSLTSGMPGKYSHTVRQPHGVAGLIVPANTPMANIAWKVFPALICGNTVVLKAAEDSPRVAYLFAKLTKQAGLPDGVFNVIQGLGQPAGSALVEDRRVAVISFTGSTSVGRWIAEVGGRRLARVSLELGGNNPFVVCDDADIDKAVDWACRSAFSNAGQRCAAGRRIIIFDAIYKLFCQKFIVKTNQLKLGVGANSDLGPVVNLRQQQTILAAIELIKQQGGKILCGGTKALDPELTNGYYVQPTVVEGMDPNAEISDNELFGPVAFLYSVADLPAALALANNTQYGLTAAIHTKNVDRAMWFAQRVRTGVANINLGTYGSEPHMPFGGFGASGNGTREPGLEALNVYSELKNISFFIRDSCI